MEIDPSASKQEDRKFSESVLPQEEKQEDPILQFICAICGISAKCRFGRVRVTGKTHSYAYREEVYYMMDPFRNRAKADKRRVMSENDKNTEREKKNNVPNILDFFVIGGLCAICGQSVCVDELCSVFYAKTFCSTCITREKVYFPPDVLQQLEAARIARKRREAEDIKVPAVEELAKDV